MEGCQQDTGPVAASGYRYDFKYFSCAIDRCATCTSSGCTACMPGFFLDGSVCQACSSNCLACSSNSVCTTCAKSFSLISNVCKPNPTIDGCEIYGGSGTCLKCESSKYLLMPNRDQCVLCTESSQIKAEGIFNFV